MIFHNALETVFEVEIPKVMKKSQAQQNLQKQEKLDGKNQPEGHLQAVQVVQAEKKRTEKKHQEEVLRETGEMTAVDAAVAVAEQEASDLACASLEDKAAEDKVAVTVVVVVAAAFEAEEDEDKRHTVDAGADTVERHWVAAIQEMAVDKAAAPFCQPVEESDVVVVVAVTVHAAAVVEAEASEEDKWEDKEVSDMVDSMVDSSEVPGTDVPLVEPSEVRGRQQEDIADTLHIAVAGVVVVAVVAVVVAVVEIVEVAEAAVERNTALAWHRVVEGTVCSTADFGRIDVQIVVGCGTMLAAVMKGILVMVDKAH